ncbi:hypothetical protein CCR91_03070 [Thiorhodovibrio winogradskyi]|nr:hypothetical protein [Thiorhodovibrio winogradskyi]
MLVIEAQWRKSSSASARLRFGAVSFIHRFGLSLNRHVHYQRLIEPAAEAGISQSDRFNVR